MLRQILEALVRPWENFFPVRDKTQAVVLAELQPQLGSSAPLAPQPESDLWTYDSPCSASQPRGDLPTGFWSSWTLCWMTHTTELLPDLSATSNSTRALWTLIFIKNLDCLKRVQRWQLQSPRATLELTPSFCSLITWAPCLSWRRTALADKLPAPLVTGETSPLLVSQQASSQQLTQINNNVTPRRLKNCKNLWSPALHQDHNAEHIRLTLPCPSLLLCSYSLQ